MHNIYPYNINLMIEFSSETIVNICIMACTVAIIANIDDKKLKYFFLNQTFSKLILFNGINFQENIRVFFFFFGKVIYIGDYSHCVVHIKNIFCTDGGRRGAKSRSCRWSRGNTGVLLLPTTGNRQRQRSLYSGRDSSFSGSYVAREIRICYNQK